MKIIFVALYILFVISCTPKQKANNINDETARLKESVFPIDTAAILKDYAALYNYIYYESPLSQTFIGLDVDSTIIDKTTFLNKLIAGGKIPLKIKLYKEEPVYRLYEPTNSKYDIISAARDQATVEIANFKMEGIQMPIFSFTDLNNINYNNSSTKGKMIVLKCWYIACTACVKEFSECNKLVEDYAKRDDILFISLAFDKKEALQTFLSKRIFKYSVIPEMTHYMEDSLKTTRYPTHILIDKNGEIVKVVNSLKELKPFLVKKAALSHI